MIEYGTVTGDGLRLHDKPEFRARVDGLLSKGEEIEILERIGRDWLRIVTKAGRRGFVAREFVRIKANLPPEPPLPTQPAPTATPGQVLAWCIVGALVVGAILFVIQ